jgi:hypothetical protein
LAEAKEGVNMELVKFSDEVNAALDLLGVGMEVGENDAVKSLIVKHEPTALESKMSLAIINDHDWDALYGIMTGRREPVVVQHMTRVVGYYSRIENWNPSKIGELADRHVGEYNVD